MFILSNWCHIYMYCDKENKHLLNSNQTLLRDLKSNAQWTDPEQHVQLDALTTFFKELYNDESLQEDSAHNPNLQFSSREYFNTNPPEPSLTDLPMEDPITQAEINTHLKTPQVWEGYGTRQHLQRNAQMHRPQRKKLHPKPLQPNISNSHLPPKMERSIHHHLTQKRS